MRSTQLIINLDSIQNNINSIRQYLGNKIKIMPIVKSFGYGTHLNECANILNQFEYVGVALLDEAIALRKNGFQNNIFILYPLSKEEFQISKNYNFILNGCNIFDLIKNDEKVKIHLEIDTGMGRTGIQIDDIDNYINKLKENKNIELDGIFTHLSTNSNIEFSNGQIRKFKKVVKKFEKNKVYIPNVHISSSGGLKYYKDNLFNMVRIGILLYGYYPNNSLKDDIKLMPCMKLKTKISFLKTIKKGDTVGYNISFVAQKNTKVATIPFGFADGLLTLETGNTYVLIDNKKVPIIGICMDNMMLDVTNIDNVYVGQDVYIWDNELLTIDEIGNWCNGICNYEVMSCISERVPRVFEGNGLM